MTRDSPIDVDITSTEEFQAALGQLLRSADRNGVDPLGSWEFRDGDRSPEIEVMILELETDGTD